jgi:zinc protease
MEMPADRWREGIALVAEVVLHPRLAPDDVEAVRSEMFDLQRRTAESPGETARFLLADSLAPDHPSAAEVLGTPESVRSITVDDLRAFHDTYVTGRRTIVTASGPVDPATVVRAVSDAFDSLSPGGDHPPIAAAPVTRPGRVVRAALGKGQAYLALGYLFESEATDREALAVAGALLSDRLSFSLREQQGLAYTLSASFSPWAGRTRFAVVMGTRPENVDAAQEGLRRELAGFSELSFDAPEVRRAATALRGRRIMRRMTRVNQAYFAAVERLEGRPRGDDARSLDALLAIEPDDIRRVVDRYFDPDRAAVVIVR